MAKRGILLSALLTAALIATATFYLYRAAQPVTFLLRLHAAVGDEALVLYEVRYVNPGGPGSFKIRDFQFFLSNIALVAKSTQYLEPDSYHLARFDDGDGVYELVLPDVPREDYVRLEFGIGVDAAANGSIESVGDLDPNGRMAWSWDVGYKFVLVEGGLVIVQGGGADQSFLAFDKATGSLKWKTGDYEMTHATPVATTIHNQRQVLFFTQKGMVSVDPKAGKQLWWAEKLRTGRFGDRF